MPKRLELWQGKPVTLDGQPLNGHLTRLEPTKEPFRLLLWDAGERLYDVELYVNGKLVGTVPERSILLDSVYDRAEAVLRDQPPPVNWRQRY